MRCGRTPGVPVPACGSGPGPPRPSHTVSGWLGRDVWLGPPVEVWARFELIVIENATALGHDVLEISKRREVLVGEWLLEDRPEVLSRLKLGRVDAIGSGERTGTIVAGQNRRGAPCQSRTT